MAHALGFAFREDNADLAPLLDASSTAWAITDGKGKLLASTEPFRTLCGLTKAAFVPRAPALQGDNAAVVYRAAARARAGETGTGVLSLGGIEHALWVAPLRREKRQSALEWRLVQKAVENSSPANSKSAALPEAAMQIFEQAPIAVALVDANGSLAFMNRQLRRVVGSSDRNRKPLMMAHVFKVAPKVARPSPKAGQGPLEVCETEAVLASDKTRCFSLVSIPFGTQRTVVFATEIKPIALPDEKLIQSQKLQAVGELAGGIAHDFNNLLTAIIGFSDLLLTRFKTSDPAFEDLVNIKNNANRAAELVNQILAYSRKQTLRPTVVALTDVIQDFHASVGRLLGEKITARIEHGRDLWVVKADEHQLFQVIMNLAVNARDAMPNGGMLTIRTANVNVAAAANLAARGLPAGEYVLCEVRDTGTGIPPEVMGRIFDPFFSTKEVGKGTGLGLSTVYGIVRQTGGTILVDSQVGAGTSFQVYLPRHRETAEEAAARSVKSGGKDSQADLTGSETVLLVEDEEAVRSFASRALKARGYTVLEAGSGVEALEVMDRQGGDVDLVVSDVVMPEMDGPTLLHHLRRRNPQIKIVFMSGYAEEAFRKTLSGDEAFTFLPKPFTLKKLAETVKAAAA
jgi:two-component system cell cycle sensor histidine kinase/response regulator CckA